MKTVLIAGGGLAGLSCAKYLIDYGFQVFLFEAASHFGGRASSWCDPRTGRLVESGVHSFLGAYSQLRTLLKEVNANINEIVSWENYIGFAANPVSTYRFGINPLHLPGLVLSVFGNNSYLNPLQKLALAKFFLKTLPFYKSYEPLTIKELALDQGLDDYSFERVIRPLSRGLFFAEPEWLSAYAFLGLVSHLARAPLLSQAGSFRGGMSETLISPLVDWLEKTGAQLRTHESLEGFDIDNELQSVSSFRMKSGEILKADVYVLGLPLETVQSLLPKSLKSFNYFSNILKLKTSPAISVQLWFDKKFFPYKYFFFSLNSPCVIFQDESYVTFPQMGSRISCQIVGAPLHIQTDEELLAFTLQELQKFIPNLSSSHLENSVVVRHQAIRLTPGTEEKRPFPSSPISNLFLCGDYTRQNWFTTMEGAVKSGKEAAIAIKNAYDASSSIEN